MNLRVSLLVALLGLASQHDDAAPPAHTYLPDSPAVLPFQQDQGTPVIECEINGHGPFRLLVDTGSSGPVIDQRLADELGLTVLGETALGDPSNPSAIRAKRVRIDELRLADAAFEGVNAVAWAPPAGLMQPGVRGILGLSLFADCTLTLDYPRGELSLRKAALPEPDGRGVLPLTRDPEGQIFSLPIQVAGKEVLVHLDTGNSASVVLPGELESQLPLVAGSRKEGSGLRANGAVSFVSAQLDGQLRVGAAVLERPQVRFMPGARANLGYDVLRRFVVSIDSRNARIRFEAPPDPARAAPAAPK